MAEIIAIVNQKGGVGKTTTATNLGAYLAALGKFVLLVDFDPQGNASSGLGITVPENRNMYNSIIEEMHFNDIIKTTAISGFKVAPSNNDLAGASVDLVNLENREFRLNEALKAIRNDYDYILIDCPPSLGLLTINALVAADKILIPVQAEYYALEGLGQLLNTIELVKTHLKPDLDILGAVLTMYDKRNNLSQEVFLQLHQYFPQRVFRSVIPRSIKLTESPSHGKTILEYDSRSKGAKAYERLARELLDINTYSY